MTRKKSATKWYVEPRDANTNETALMDLAQKCGASEDKIHRGKKDNKGVSRDVIEVDHAFITRLKANTEKFKLMFRTYVQARGDHAMKLWTFEDKKGVRGTKKVVQVQRALECLGKNRVS